MKTTLKIGPVQQTGSYPAVLVLEDEGQPAQGRHHILLDDCSGSMSGVIKRLRTDTAAFVQSLNGKDRVTVIIYSGHGRARVIAGPTVCDDVGKRAVVAAIERDVRVLDTTVFSEPLALAIKTAKALGGDVVTAATLFTDGCAVPTEWSVAEEQFRSINLARALYDLGVLVSVIGYGVYYDATFLGKLDEASGHTGVYRHISEIEDLSDVVADIRDIVAATTPKRMSLAFTPSGTTAVKRVLRAAPELFSSEGGAVHLGSMYEGKAILFLELSGSTSSIRITGTVNGKKVDVTPEIEQWTDADTKDYLRLAAGAAFIAGDRSGAEKLYRAAGDAGLADRAGNAYTPREQREVADMARRVYKDRAFIGAGLKDTGPNNNILNVLRVLIEDQGNVVFLPKGAYERSGELTADRRVIESGDRVLKVTGYASHDSRLNFSIRALKDVKVLPGEGEDGGPVDAKVWRSYNIILDRNLHLPELEAVLSQASFDKLKDAGVLNGATDYRRNEHYHIDLRDLKMVSPVWANPKTLGLVPLLHEEADLEVKQKALNARLKELNYERAEFEGTIYHSKAEKVEGRVTEEYEAPNVEIRLMGYKGAPFDASKLSADEAYKLVQEVRRRLIVVRFIYRSIIFAIETVGSTAIAWGAPKITKRGTYPREEREARFDGATLKRVAWDSTEVCS